MGDRAAENLNLLRDAVDRGRLVVVTGAGASSAMAPAFSDVVGSWSGFVNAIVRETAAWLNLGQAWVDAALAMDLDERADHVSDAVKRHVDFIGAGNVDYTRLVYRVMHYVAPAPVDYDSEDSVRASLGDAIRMLTPFVATLNYDMILEDLLGRVEINLLVNPVDPNHASRFVYHLHGAWFDATGFVLTRAEYAAERARFRKAVDQLIDPPVEGVGASRNMLFIGVGGGLLDEHMLPELQRLRGLQPRQCHFVLERADRVEQKTAALHVHGLHDFVRVVSYGANYADLAPFLWRLSAKRAVTMTVTRARVDADGNVVHGAVTVDRDGEGNPVIAGANPPDVPFMNPELRQEVVRFVCRSHTRPYDVPQPATLIRRI